MNRCKQAASTRRNLPSPGDSSDEQGATDLDRATASSARATNNVESLMVPKCLAKTHSSLGPEGNTCRNRAIAEHKHNQRERPAPTKIVDNQSASKDNTLQQFAPRQRPLQSRSMKIHPYHPLWSTDVNAHLTRRRHDSASNEHTHKPALFQTDYECRTFCFFLMRLHLAI